MNNIKKIFIMFILISICFFITIYFHVFQGIGYVFTHFFYIPIILASLWWNKRGIIVSIILSIFILISHFTLRESIDTNNDLFRIVFFLIVSYTVAQLSEQIKRTTAESTMNKERFREMFNNMSSGVVVYEVIGEADDFIIKDFNKASERIDKINKNEVIGKRITEIFPCIKECGQFELLKRVWQTGEPEKYPITHYKGCKIDGWRENYVCKLSSGCIFSIYDDVTERKRAEEERKKLEAQFVQAQKMESVGRLAGGIAHDFNNILTVIIGNAELALMSISPQDNLYEEMSEIKDSAERAAELTNQLLAFSRRQIIKPKITNMNKVLLKIDKMLCRIVGEDIKLVTIPGENLWNIMIDPGQIEQVLTNLVVNSRDAMPKGGKITIETANVFLDEEYENTHSNVQSGNYVMMAVSDTGIGMNNDIKAHIFEPFYTTKDQGKGTGLGLATCYGIVKQNNGNIWIYSEPGQGTTFKIYFPVVAEQQENIPGIPLKADMQSGKETILVVEDESSVSQMIVRTLKSYGYSVLEATNGEEAIRVVEKSDRDIHLVLSDIVMPVMGGPEITEKLKEYYPNIKIIFMSGYTDSSIVHHRILEPGFAFIQKPFSPSDITKKVRLVLDE